MNPALLLPLIEAALAAAPALIADVKAIIASIEGKSEGTMPAIQDPAKTMADEAAKLAAAAAK